MGWWKWNQLELNSTEGDDAPVQTRAGHAGEDSFDVIFLHFNVSETISNIDITNGASWDVRFIGDSANNILRAYADIVTCIHDQSDITCFDFTIFVSFASGRATAFTTPS